MLLSYITTEHLSNRLSLSLFQSRICCFLASLGSCMFRNACWFWVFQLFYFCSVRFCLLLRFTCNEKKKKRFHMKIKVWSIEKERRRLIIASHRREQGNLLGWPKKELVVCFKGILFIIIIDCVCERVSVRKCRKRSVERNKLLEHFMAFFVRLLPFSPASWFCVIHERNKPRSRLYVHVNLFFSCTNFFILFAMNKFVGLCRRQPRKREREKTFCNFLIPCAIQSGTDMMERQTRKTLKGKLRWEKNHSKGFAQP